MTTKPGPVDICENWVNMDDSAKTALKTKYKAANVMFMVSAFGSTDAPTTSKKDPKTTADQLAEFVKANQFDGVDIDYEDMNAMAAGTAEAWLISLTNELRAKLPSPYLNAPLAPWFTPNKQQYPGGGYLEVHKGAGSNIDFYQIQFYNQDGTVNGAKVSEYTSCDSLLTKSQVFAETSLYEIAANGVDINKLLIGKPSTAADATNGGFMTPADLAPCVSQAKKDKNWNAGLMLWEYGDQPDNYVKTAWGS
ncbi:glycoside hydrolase [Meredithblackwellia eburnea MCA 4105]